MTRSNAHKAIDARPARTSAKYNVTAQVGYLLRTASQRHSAIFAEHMVAGLTRPQFAALVKLHDGGIHSQNDLGRAIEMDRVTIKGVVDRLHERGFIERTNDPVDRRRISIALSDEGRQVVQEGLQVAKSITRKTLSPLTREEAEQLVFLLRKIS
jgi:DNA-binding MarR family transcriptional regulator